MCTRLFLLFAVLLCISCAEAVIGGIGVSSVLFSKHEYTIFSSRMVYSVKKKIDDVLYANDHSKKSIKLVQEGDIIYAVGLVKSSTVKNRVIDVLNAELNKHYVDEISISAAGRKYTTDLYLKTKIRQKLLFAKYVKSQNYTILVYNQKAYVVGKASNSAEKDIVVNGLAQIEYIDDIIAYITI
ncbi:MAG: hypothetical protein O3A66_00720 [Proteobacteria bacterium]|jgi:osmotically-inducible protein OsmY|nr:hypothetical protein [Pseudomonadota bacterium]